MPGKQKPASSVEQGGGPGAQQHAAAGSSSSAPIPEPCTAAAGASRGGWSSAAAQWSELCGGSFIQQHFRLAVPGAVAHRTAHGAVVYGRGGELTRRAGAAPCPRPAPNRLARLACLQRMEPEHMASFAHKRQAFRAARAAAAAAQQQQQQQHHHHHQLPPVPLPPPPPPPRQQQPAPASWQQLRRQQAARCRPRAHPSAAAVHQQGGFRAQARRRLQDGDALRELQVAPFGDASRALHRHQLSFSVMCSAGLLGAHAHSSAGRQRRAARCSPAAAAAAASAPPGAAASRCVAQRDEQGNLIALPPSCIGAGSRARDPNGGGSSSGSSSSGACRRSMCLAGIGCDRDAPVALQRGRQRALWSKRRLQGQRSGPAGALAGRPGPQPPGEDAGWPAACAAWGTKAGGGSGGVVTADAVLAAAAFVRALALHSLASDAGEGADSSGDEASGGDDASDGDEEPCVRLFRVTVSACEAAGEGVGGGPAAGLGGDRDEVLGLVPDLDPDLRGVQGLHPAMAAAVAEPYAFRTAQGVVYGFWSKSPLG